MSTTEVQKHEHRHTYCIIHLIISWLKFFLSLSVDPDILNGAYMSEALNDVFIDNFQKDPTLTWQYFGSATGFFRLYPGESPTSYMLPKMSVSSVARVSCVGTVLRRHKQSWSKHSAAQAKQYTYTATDDAGNCLSSVMTQSQLQYGCW